ncbi:lipoprotein [Bacillus wiedmannii]|nr:lipoprotein [Bacillus wiedmannii]
MKKIIVTGLALGLLAGCGSTDSKSEAKDNTTQSSNSETSNKKTSKYPFPKDATPVGEGKITVDTPAGNSKNGNVPVLFADKNTIMDQIGIDYANFQGDKQTFVYIDKIFIKTTQVGELTQSTFSLEEDT